MVFAAVRQGLISIATGSYLDMEVEQYHAIPKNDKGLFHIMIQQVEIGDLKSSIGINYKAYPNVSGTSIEKIYTIADLGDLSTMYAHRVYNAAGLRIEGNVILDNPANFDLLENGETILAFRNGILRPKQ